VTRRLGTGLAASRFGNVSAYDAARPGGGAIRVHRVAAALIRPDRPLSIADADWRDLPGSALQLLLNVLLLIVVGAGGCACSAGSGGERRSSYPCPATAAATPYVR